MKRIDTGRRKPDPENPNRLIYDGQRTAQDIFAELRYRLETTGYLPDEYFLLNRDWENGREWPEDSDIFCTVNYGGSEGIYLDIYMKYQDEKDEPQTKSFATGKTLGEADEDLDRMYLIASAVTKAFHSDGVHARYVRLGEPDPPKGAVVHLNTEEQKIITDSLIDTRLRWKQESKPFEKIEQLLRRIIGSITEYIRAVGDRPRTLDDYDRASLAIADGDMAEFNEVFPKVSLAYGSLLKEAAARPGNIGYEMTMRICSEAPEITNDIFLHACKNAVDIAEQLKAALLNVQGQYTVEELDDIEGIDNHAIPADPLVKNFSYALVTPATEPDNVDGQIYAAKVGEGEVYFRENSLMYPVDLPATTLERIKGMITLRECVQELINLQLDEHEEAEITAKQAELSALYDRFTVQYGLINSQANNGEYLW